MIPLSVILGGWIILTLFYWSLLYAHGERKHGVAS